MRRVAALAVDISQVGIKLKFWFPHYNILFQTDFRHGVVGEEGGCLGRESGSCIVM